MSHSSELLNLRGAIGTPDFVAKLDRRVTREAPNEEDSLVGTGP